MTGADRAVIAHIHLFKNAGTSVERVLQHNHGDRWLSYDGDPPGKNLQVAEVLDVLRQHPQVLSLSSHQLRPPLAPTPGFALVPIVFLRHPIDRIRSAWSFERRQGPVSPSARVAASSTPAEWIDFHRGRGSVQVLNFHVRGLSLLRNENGGPRNTEPIAAHRASANEFMAALPSFGLVERFTDSWTLLGPSIRAHFPDFEVIEARANVTKDSADDIEGRLGDYAELIGQAEYDRLIEENAEDLDFYETWSQEFQRRLDVSAPA